MPDRQSALSPVSPVRMRQTWSIVVTKILPSPTLPVLAASTIASTTRSTRSSETDTSLLAFGRKSTTYSAPRYNSVWPRWRPKPLTSLTVMPWIPTSPSALRTSSRRKGFTMAVTSFIRWISKAEYNGAYASKEPDKRPPRIPVLWPRDCLCCCGLHCRVCRPVFAVVGCECPGDGVVGARHDHRGIHDPRMWPQHGLQP